MDVATKKNLVPTTTTTQAKDSTATASPANGDRSEKQQKIQTKESRSTSEKRKTIEMNKMMTIGGINRYDTELGKATQAQANEPHRPKNNPGPRTTTRGSGVAAAARAGTAADLLVSGPGLLARAQIVTRTLTGCPVQKHIITRLTTEREQNEIRAKAEANKRITSRQRQLLQLLLPPFNQISSITPSVALTGSGGLIAERMAAFGRPIRCVINVTYELPLIKTPEIESFRVPVEDDQRESLSMYFDEVTAKMHEFTANGFASLVHCMAGVSRSSAIVIAYLIRYEKMSLEQAFRHTKTNRPIINPNVGFLLQLSGYESQILPPDRCSQWCEHTQRGITKRLPKFIIDDFLQDYQIEFEGEDDD